MPDGEVLLGVIADAEGDEIEVRAEDGTVTLRWEHGCDIVLGRTARDELRELLDRAAMPGQRERAAIAHVVTDPDDHRRHGCPTCLHARDDEDEPESERDRNTDYKD